MSPRRPFEFHGGHTAAHFILNEGREGCWHPGEELRLRWDTCNATRVQLTIEDVVGNVLLNQEPSSRGSYPYTLPELSANMGLTITLRAEGPCGEDLEVITVRVGRSSMIDVSDLSPMIDSHWENWHRNLSRPSIGIITPDATSDKTSNPSQVVNAVLTAERFNQRLGVVGSGWSYSPCVVPRRTTHFMLKTDHLNSLLKNVIGLPLAADRVALRDEENLRSVLPQSTLARVNCLDGPCIDDVRRRLVHVEGGIKIHELNCWLDNFDLAMPTLGGANGQSIVGAASTSTHGANPDLPPIVDFIRAIHLVSTGGQEWWIEPARNPITERDRMIELSQRGILDPCIKLVYDDQLFDACLVSLGCAGIIYSVVIEVVNRHNLQKDIRTIDWRDAQTYINDNLLNRTVQAPWFFELTLNPTRQCWLTTYTPTSSPATGIPHFPPLDQVIFDGLEGGALLARIINSVNSYIIERSLDLANPINLFRIDEIIRDIELMLAVLDELTRLHALLDIHNFDRRLAELVVSTLNLLWKLGGKIDAGRDIVEDIQNMMTNYLRTPTASGSPVIAKSYSIMTNQKDCRGPDYESPEEHSEMEKLIESYEYIFPENQGIPFVNGLLAIADGIRHGEEALILIVNLRFTLASRAFLAMQQYDRSFHVEIWTAKGLDGNAAFHTRMKSLAEEYGGIPHWGHLHEASPDFETLYTNTDAHSGRMANKLRIWESQMNRLAQGGGSRNPNTFRHGFAIERRMLSEL